MNAVRQRKMLFLIMSLFVLSLVIGLVLYALQQNINLFFTPTQLTEGAVSPKQLIRLGGMVVKNSIIRGSDGLSVEFRLTDLKKTITVNYHGILPDLFREGQGIVALGHLGDNQHFIAQEVLAKHDENYMPPEVKNALAKTSSSQNFAGSAAGQKVILSEKSA